MIDQINPEIFAFDSVEQKKVYLAFAKWSRDRGLPVDVRPFDLFMVQELMNLHSHITEQMAEQMKMAWEQLTAVHKSMQSLRAEVEFLSKDCADGEIEKLT